jgi:hypothetical protein
MLWSLKRMQSPFKHTLVLRGQKTSITVEPEFWNYILCGNYAVVGARTDNLLLWQTIRMQCTGRLLERGCKVGVARAN